MCAIFIFIYLNIFDIFLCGKLKFGRIGRVIGGNIKVLSFGLKNKMDLMHFHDPELLPVMVLFRLLGRKLIFDMHENLPFQILTKTYMPKIQRRILSKCVEVSQRIVFRFVPVVFAEFSYAKYFTKVNHHKTILNYPLKSEFKTISETKKEIFTLGYMGSVAIERGSLIMLQVVEELRSKGENINVLFVGPIVDDLESLPIFKKAVQQGWAIFKGRLKPKEGWCFMAQCHIGMAVLKDSPNFIESYPTKLFEYMLLKLPIITSNFPLYTNIINDAQCGVVVNPSSKEEISDAILKIKNNKFEMQLMGERGFEKAIDKYSWESSELSKVRRLYKEVLQ